MPPDEGPVVLPSVPVYSLATIGKVRKHISDAILFPLYGCHLEGDAFEYAVGKVAQYLKVEDRALEALRKTMSVLAGKELSLESAQLLGWRIAGNIEKIRGGDPAMPWIVQRGPEWVPMQITGGRRFWQKRQKGPAKFGWTYLCSVLAGSPTGTDIRQWWSTEKVMVVASCLGFSRKPPYHREDMAELVGLRFYGLLEPKLSDRAPGFFHIHCPTSFSQYNRGVLKLRRRIDFVCPSGFDHPCHRCFVGAKECPAATHRETYIARPCPGCKREWWFDTDPRFLNDHCVHCQPRFDSGMSLGTITD